MFHWKFVEKLSSQFQDLTEKIKNGKMMEKMFSQILEMRLLGQ